MFRPSLSFVLILSVTTVCGIGGFIIYKQLKMRRPPKKWKKIGNVLKLYSYPLKSGRYVEHDKVECTKFGFSHITNDDSFKLRDRSFIIYGESDLVGKSARIYPSMVLITVSSYDKTHIILNAPEMDTLIFEIPIKSQENVKQIKFQDHSNERVLTIDCGDNVSKWVSQYLIQKKSGLRLGYHDISSFRDINSISKTDLKFYKHLTNSAFGLYSDLAALLLLNEKTFNDLKGKIEGNISRAQFRANIIVDGPELTPFIEDNWFWIKIGDEVVVRNIKECVRCVLTTVNPETGMRDMDREPLKTLSKYRISKGPAKGPIMGINLDVVIPGIIHVNDEVFIGNDE